MSTVLDDPLSLTFSALADPTRRAMLARLAAGEASVNQLAEPFDMSVQAVSKHIKVLERAGLVSKSRDGQLRPCRLEAAALEGASGWIDEQHEIWQGRLDRLERHLQQLQSTAKTSKRK